MATDEKPILDPATLTITQHQQFAKALSDALDKVLGMFPRSDQPRHVTAKYIRSRLNVPADFLLTAIVGAEENPGVTGLSKLDPNLGRDTLQLADAYRPVIDKLARCQKELTRAVNLRLAFLTDDARDFYALVKSLSRDETNPAWAALAEALKRDLGRADAMRKNAAKKTAIEKAAIEKSLATEPRAETA